MNPAASESDEIAELFRVLGHPVRMAILRVLGDGERAVSEVANATGIMMSTLSQQLAILRKAELVGTRRDAKQVFYSLNPQTFVRVSAAVDALCLSHASGKSTTAPIAPAPGRVGAAMFARVQPRI